MCISFRQDSLQIAHAYPPRISRGCRPDMPPRLGQEAPRNLCISLRTPPGTCQDPPGNAHEVPPHHTLCHSPQDFPQKNTSNDVHACPNAFLWLTARNDPRTWPKSLRIFACRSNNRPRNFHRFSKDSRSNHPSMPTGLGQDLPELCKTSKENSRRFTKSPMPICMSPSEFPKALAPKMS